VPRHRELRLDVGDAMAERRDLLGGARLALDEIAPQPVQVGAHFPQLRFGRVVTVAGKRTFRPIA